MNKLRPALARLLTIIVALCFMALVLIDPESAVAAGSQDDTVTLYAGAEYPLPLYVLDNDQDPNGLPLKVCDYEQVDPQWGQLTLTDGVLYGVVLSANAGSATTRYANCNGSKEVWHNVTIVPIALKRLHVSAVKGKPGYLRVSNPNQALEGEVLYGRYKEFSPDGDISVKPGVTKLVHLSRKALRHKHSTLDWVGTLMDDNFEVLISYRGHLRMTYPTSTVPAAARPAPLHFTAQQLRTWHAAS